MSNINDVKQIIKNDVMSELNLIEGVNDETVLETIDKVILSKNLDTYIPLRVKMDIRNDIFNSIRRLDVLSELLDDSDVTEIMVNGANDIFIEKSGRLFKYDKSFESEERLKAIVQQIVAECNRVVNESSPIVDARLLDGSRVNVVLPPVTLSGTTLTIRKFPKTPMTMQNLIDIGSLNEEVVNFLNNLVIAGYNIFISGGTGSGKTTFLNALSDFIPKDERIITIEDSAELQIVGVSNLVRLEARNVNVEGKNAVSIRDLIKASLRMRPNRIIVGEVRDAAAIDMLQAMNTGHDGSLSTGHANSAKDMLSRLETMVLMGMNVPIEAIRQQISSAIDIIVHLGRVRDKTRKVLQICEVIGVEYQEYKINTLYEFVEEEKRGYKVVGELRKINDLINVDKLMSAGIFDVIREEKVEDNI